MSGPPVLPKTSSLVCDRKWERFNSLKIILSFVRI